MTNVVKSGRGIYRPSEMRGAVLFAKLVSALMETEDPKSYDELADLTGLHVHTVRRYLMAMRENRPRVARIAEWGTDVRGNPSIRMFTLGRKPDAPRPKQTNAERQRKAAARKRALALHKAIVG